jgi:SAM-dependent methyltransferase
MSDGFRVKIEPEVRRSTWSSVDLLGPEGLRRDDEREDDEFYRLARRRPFFGDRTDRVLRAHHARLIPHGARRVLDLMSSLATHVEPVAGREIVGIGLNAREMASNPALSRIVVQDLNRTPDLRFEDGAFDAVLCSGSLDLLVHPLELIRETARVLRPGGVCIVSFTDRMIQPKCVHAWREADNEGRIVLATSYFSFSGAFMRPFVEEEELHPQVASHQDPHDDTILTVVWGYRPPATEIVTERKVPLQRRQVPSDLHCPWCATRMQAWQPPETPWEMDYGVGMLHVCFNDDCPYFTRGAKWCRRNGMRCSSYRHSRNPETGTEGPLPVPTRAALRGGILDEN